MFLVNKIFGTKEEPVKKESNIDITSCDLVSGCAIFFEKPLRIPDCKHHVLRILKEYEGGYKFAKDELNDVFMKVTLLAYSTRDLRIHRLVLILLKELEVSNDTSMMICNSISKDLSDDDMYIKSWACLYIASILPPLHIIQSLHERIKETIYSQNSYMCSAGLLCAIKIAKHEPKEVIRHLIPAVTGVLSSGPVYSRHLALILLYLLRQNDPVSLGKILDEYGTSHVEDSVSAQVLISMAINTYRNKPNNESLKVLHYHLSSTAFPDSTLDAIRAVLSLDNPPEDLVSAAVSKLNIFLAKDTYIEPCAALNTISKFIDKYPNAFSACSSILERLLVSKYPTLSTNAALALFNIGYSATIDRVLDILTNNINTLSQNRQVLLIKAAVKNAEKLSKYEEICSFLWTNYQRRISFDIDILIIRSYLEFSKKSKYLFNYILENYLFDYIEDTVFHDGIILVVDYLSKHVSSINSRMNTLRFLYNRYLLEHFVTQIHIVEAISSFLNFADTEKYAIYLIRQCKNSAFRMVVDTANFYEKAYEKKYTQLLNLDCSALDPISEKSQTKDSKVTPVSENKSEPLVQSMNEIARMISGCGQLIYTSPVIQCNDFIELKVSCIAYLFTTHLVLSFQIFNELGSKIIIERCEISSESEFSFDSLNNVDSIESEKENAIMLYCAFAEGSQYPSGRLTVTLDFHVDGDSDVITEESSLVPELLFATRLKDFPDVSTLRHYKNYIKNFGIPRASFNESELHKISSAIARITGLRQFRIPDTKSIQFAGMIYGQIVAIVIQSNYIGFSRDSLTIKFDIHGETNNIIELIIETLRGYSCS